MTAVRRGTPAGAAGAEALEDAVAADVEALVLALEELLGWKW